MIRFDLRFKVQHKLRKHVQHSSTMFTASNTGPYRQASGTPTHPRRVSIRGSELPASVGFLLRIMVQNCVLRNDCCPQQMRFFSLVSYQVCCHEYIQYMGATRSISMTSVAQCLEYPALVVWLSHIIDGIPDRLCATGQRKYMENPF